MKKVNPLLITLLLVFNFTSCSNDEVTSISNDNTPEEIDPSKPSIEGSWEIIGYQTQNAEVTTTSIDGTQTTMYSETGSNFDVVTKYTTDPNISSTFGSFDVTTTYQGFPPTIRTASNFITSEWEIIDENKLTSTINETTFRSTFTSTITELTKNTLVLETDLSQTQTDSSSNIKYSGILRTTYLRIVE